MTVSDGAHNGSASADIDWQMLAGMGLSIFPVQPHGKRPAVKWQGYQKRKATPIELRTWAAGESNAGIVTGTISGVVVLDLDSADAIAEAKRRGLPDTASVRTAKGLHLCFRHPGGEIGNRAGIFSGADIRGDGGYVVAPGSVHESGHVYVWDNPPGMFDIAEMPAWLAEMLISPNPKPQPANDRGSASTGRAQKWADAALDDELKALRAAPEGRRNAQLNRAAFALGQLAAHLNVSQTVELLASTARAIGLSGDEVEATITSGWAAGMAVPRDGPPERERPKPAKEKSKSAGAKGKEAGAEVSEDAIAQAFTAQYGQHLRFDHHAGKWYQWIGSHWQRNETKLAFHYARELARELSDGDSGFSRASVANGAEAFARADPVHAVTSEIWDTDAMLLGTPGGTVDLKTGRWRNARPGDMITRLTGVAPLSGAPVRWLQFLREATGGDDDLIRFLQQMIGYCLTGDTREHALFFIYGPGGNGKSVFLDTLNYVLGDYATTAGMDTFTASRNDRHPTDLAMLKGARLVSASETEEGRAWAESRIKQMTGGDKISARFMRQDFFTFTPQFKLVIVGNHAPVLANVDAAARRRFNIIPFTCQPEAPDKTLPEKLKEEAGQILAWAILGCMDWQENGLVRPEIVQVATQDYFDDQDLFGQWLNNRCERGRSKFEMTTPLYNDWVDYARAAGEEPGSQRAMSSKLKRAGFQHRNANGVRAYYGLQLKRQGDYHG